jgi:ribonuclease D
MPEVPQERPGPRPSPALVALLKVLLAAKCEQHHVAARLVAGSDDIERLAVEAAPDVPALHGWRRAVFGEDALALRQGRVALGVDGRQVRLVPVPADREPG